MTRTARPTRTTLLNAYADIDNAIAHLGSRALGAQADAAPELLHLIVTDEPAARDMLIGLAQTLEEIILDTDGDTPADRDLDAAADYLEDALANLA